MTTKAKLVEDIVYNAIKTGTDPKVSAFVNIGRPIICMDVARAKIEVYGKGMPRTNKAINTLLAEGKIVRTYKGRNTYFAIAKTNRLTNTH